MSVLIGIWLGVGLGLVVSDTIDDGWPTDWRTWVNYVLCPVLWPVAVYRARRRS